jgi:hypothetical protein
VPRRSKHPYKHGHLDIPEVGSGAEEEWTSPVDWSHSPWSLSLDQVSIVEISVSLILQSPFEVW